MKSFFKTGKFKALLAVFLVLLGVMIYSASSHGFAGIPSQIVNFVTTPFQKIGSGIYSAADGFFSWIGGINYLWDENDELKKENDELKKSLIDYDNLKRENDHFREYLGIAKENPNMTFVSSFVIGRDSQDKYGSFTIDKGSRDGVSPGDPVITSQGLVGRVWEVSYSSSKVSTILDDSINVGVMVSSTRDTGIVNGDLSLAEKQMTKLMYLNRSSGAKEGDLLTTTGISGIYPKGLIVGKIKEIHTEVHGKSLYAIVEPVVSPASIKDVFVITSFDGEIDKNK